MNRLTICPDCGRQYKKKMFTQVRCKACQSEHGKSKEKNGLTKDAVCLKTDCVYSMMIGHIHACDYLGIKGKRRGCPADNCDKYEPRRKRGKNEQKAVEEKI